MVVRQRQPCALMRALTYGGAIRALSASCCCCSCRRFAVYVAGCSRQQQPAMFVMRARRERGAARRAYCYAARRRYGGARCQRHIRVAGSPLYSYGFAMPLMLSWIIVRQPSRAAWYRHRHLPPYAVRVPSCRNGLAAWSEQLHCLLSNLSRLTPRVPPSTAAPDRAM